MQSKELFYPEILTRVAQATARGQPIVFTNGCFDIFHAGHARFLQACKRFNHEYLIVGVNSDDSVRRLKGASRPVNCVADRVAVLCALEVVDAVIIFEEDDPSQLLTIIRPRYYAKGPDYNMYNCVAPNRGIDSLALHGTQFRPIDILDQCAPISTSAIIRRVTASANN